MLISVSIVVCAFSVNRRHHNTITLIIAFWYPQIHPFPSFARLCSDSSINERTVALLSSLESFIITQKTFPWNVPSSSSRFDLRRLTLISAIVIDADWRWLCGDDLYNPGGSSSAEQSGHGARKTTVSHRILSFVTLCKHPHANECYTRYRKLSFCLTHYSTSSLSPTADDGRSITFTSPHVRKC